ncbi:unnamed protein product [Prorocentrum cordatum]|uniref:PB1 domain-containing protein n=1 Tax=Prorocentrum cordatum TaxID=2364126 RepID=A0ABN9R7L8_9DINO|nr:unnamed protein product [Polarella glacialis]
MSEDELVVKVDLEGDVRRLRARLPPRQGAGEEARYAALQATIVEGFKLPEGSPHLVLKYRDEEEDLCTLVEATLADFLQGASGRGPLKLVASRAPAPDARAPADPAAAPLQAAAQSRLNPEAPAFVQQSPAQDAGARRRKNNTWGWADDDEERERREQTWVRRRLRARNREPELPQRRAPEAPALPGRAPPRRSPVLEDDLEPGAAVPPDPGAEGASEAGED